MFKNSITVLTHDGKTLYVTPVAKDNGHYKSVDEILESLSETPHTLTKDQYDYAMENLKEVEGSLFKEVK